MRDPRSSIKRSVRRTATAVRRGALWVDDRALRVETYRRDGSVAEGDVAIAHLPPTRFLRFAFNAVLRRDPDAGAEASYLPRLESGEITPQDVLDELRAAPELRFTVPIRDLMLSLHHSRCDFVRTFPRARRIVDLGGTDQADQWGALVASLHYPYPFEELTIVDLPLDDRHDLYRHSDQVDGVETPWGRIRYRYHSMTDLSGFADGETDLVYSGQTIEHVTAEDADIVLKEVHRILRPGGTLALDTPNRTVCRLQQASLINPDHQLEYSAAELVDKIERAGLEVTELKGLNYLGHPASEGGFDREVVARNTGMYGQAEDCYLLAVTARRPG
jgi:predicted SAM-dependent methyltransferase